MIATWARSNAKIKHYVRAAGLFGVDGYPACGVTTVTMRWGEHSDKSPCPRCVVNTREFLEDTLPRQRAALCRDEALARAILADAGDEVQP